MLKFLVFLTGLLSHVLSSNSCQSKLVDFSKNSNFPFQESNPQHLDSRIVNGVPIPAGQLRNLAKLKIGVVATCTATLLKISDYIYDGGDKFFAITAGHCVKGSSDGPSQYSRGLVLQWNPNSKKLADLKDFQVGRVFQHPGYNTAFWTVDNDNKAYKSPFSINDIAVIEVFMTYTPWENMVDKLDLFPTADTTTTYIQAGFGVISASGTQADQGYMINNVKIETKDKADDRFKELAKNNDNFLNIVNKYMTSQDRIIVTAQSTAYANSGDSGGPLFTASGTGIAGVTNVRGFVDKDNLIAFNTYASTASYKTFIQAMMKEIADPPNGQFTLMEVPYIDKSYTISETGIFDAKWLDAIVPLNVPVDPHADNTKKNLCALSSLSQDCKKVSVIFSEFANTESVLNGETEPLYSTVNLAAADLTKKVAAIDKYIETIYALYLQYNCLNNPQQDICKKIDDLYDQTITNSRNPLLDDIVTLIKSTNDESFLFFKYMYIRQDKPKLPVRYEFCASLPKLFGKFDVYCKLFSE